jgi:hypothetical protein
MSSRELLFIDFEAGQGEKSMLFLTRVGLDR